MACNYATYSEMSVEWLTLFEK